MVAEEVGSSTDRLQMPEDQDGGCNAASASVVTSLAEISLWLNGVMDDEWWVCPAGANAQPSRPFTLRERQEDVEDFCMPLANIS